MKKLILVLLTPVIFYAQYYGERTTGQSFEQSDLYFNSHFLNTFGLLSFKNSAPGFIDEPFLNLALNPAMLPEIKGDALLYLDFRGDRSTPEIVDNYNIPHYYYYDAAIYRPYVDPRWLTRTRTEPEPVASLGMLMYPFKDITDRLFLGGTYQYIHKEEKFYQIPYWIYNSSYYYDALGVKNEGVRDVPIEDRYKGRDDMVNDGHLFSAFAGFKLFSFLNLGVSLNGVYHTRDGGYLDQHSDEYGQTDENDWANLYEQNRNQEYSHLDWSAGVLYKPSESTGLGVKAGILQGDADQVYNSRSFYFSQYKTPGEGTDWYYYYSNSSTDQKWNQDGKTKYLSFNFLRNKENKGFSAYYKYSVTEIDLSTSGLIADTSNNSSKWTNTYNGINTSEYWGNSMARDIRTGTGLREKKVHQGLVSFFWKLTKLNTVRLGFFFQDNRNTISETEPVFASRRSEYHHRSTEYPQWNYDNSYNLTEDKMLVWSYTADYQTIQIPVLLDFNFNEFFALTLGISRTLEKWDIRNETIAYFTVRERLENGVVKTEKDFGERYTQAPQKITENSTDFIMQMKASISEQFRISLLLDPEFSSKFQFAQWWLSFNAEL